MFDLFPGRGGHLEPLMGARGGGRGLMGRGPVGRGRGGGPPPSLMANMPLWPNKDTNQGNRDPFSLAPKKRVGVLMKPQDKLVGGYSCGYSSQQFVGQ